MHLCGSPFILELPVRARPDDSHPFAAPFLDLASSSHLDYPPTQPTLPDRCPCGLTALPQATAASEPHLRYVGIVSVPTHRHPKSHTILVKHAVLCLACPCNAQYTAKKAPILRTPPTVSTTLLVPASHTSHTSRPHRPTVPFTHVFVSAIHRKPFGSIPRESSVCHSGPLNPKFIARRPCSAQCILPPPASSACLSCIPARRAPVESLSSCGPCPRSPPAPCPSPC